MGRRSGRAAAVVAVVALTVFVSGENNALAACSSINRGHVIDHYYDGAYDNSSSFPVTSAEATIRAYNPHVDSASNSGVFAWPMLDEASCTDGGLVQVGQWALSSTTTDVFTEVNNCLDTGANEIVYRGSNANENHHFVVNMSSQSGNYSLKVDNTTIRSGSTDFVADEAQYFGETHSESDQMYGGVNNRTAFTAVTKCTYNGVYTCGDPIGTTSSPGVSESYFGQTISSGTLYIWDKACST